jgi:hypothetical protein
VQDESVAVVATDFLKRAFFLLLKLGPFFFAKNDKAGSRLSLLVSEFQHFLSNESIS